MIIWWKMKVCIGVLIYCKILTTCSCDILEKGTVLFMRNFSTFKMTLLLVSVISAFYEDRWIYKFKINHIAVERHLPFEGCCCAWASSSWKKSWVYLIWLAWCYLNVREQAAMKGVLVWRAGVRWEALFSSTIES